MNMGNRSGILFEYSISGPDYIRYHQSEYEEPGTILPSIIQSGDGIYVTPSITLQLPSELNWEDFLETKKYIEVEVRFKTSKTFPWSRSKKNKIQVDIKHIRSSAGLVD